MLQYAGWQASSLARVNLVISEKPILLMRTTDMSLDMSTDMTCLQVLPLGSTWQ